MRRRIGEGIARLARGRLGHRLLVRALPRAIRGRFDPVAAGDLNATMELAVRHPHGGAATRYELTIAGDRCQVRPGAPPQPGARATIGADDLIRLASGAVGWPQLLSSGRFELTGDPFLALRFASLFRLPVVLEPTSALSRLTDGG